MDDFSLFDQKFSDFIADSITAFSESRTELSVFYAPDYKFQDATRETVHELPTIALSLPHSSSDVIYIQFAIGRVDDEFTLLARQADAKRPNSFSGWFDITYSSLDLSVFNHLIKNYVNYTKEMLIYYKNGVLR